MRRFVAPLALTAAVTTASEQITVAHAVAPPKNVAFKLLESTFAASDANSPLSYEMADVKGTKYVCSSTPEAGDSGSADGKSSVQALHRALVDQCYVYSPGGYWAYEWCYQESVNQFHVGPDTQRDPEWSLGSYAETLVEYADGSSVSDDGSGGAASGLSAADTPVISLREVFEDGQHCDETGKPRHTEVHYSCCEIPDRTLPVQILGLRELRVCSYILDVCSPLLCGDGGFPNATPLQLLGQGPPCLPQRRENWWTYEFCHHGALRQFHAVPAVDEHGKHVYKTEAEYILGNFNATAAQEAFKPIPEDGIKGNEEESSAPGPPGGERQLALEYDGGTPCDVSPTGEAAQRSATVLFRCDAATGIASVREDTTCHYEVVVVSPQLCRHPALRRKPAPTRTIVCQAEDGTILPTTPRNEGTL